MAIIYIFITGMLMYVKKVTCLFWFSCLQFYYFVSFLSLSSASVREAAGSCFTLYCTLVEHLAAKDLDILSLELVTTKTKLKRSMNERGCKRFCQGGIEGRDMWESPNKDTILLLLVNGFNKRCTNIFYIYSYIMLF